MVGAVVEVIRLARIRHSRQLVFELIKERVELDAIKDDAGALLHRVQPRAPLRVEGAALDADVGHCFCVGEAAFHGHLPSSVGVMAGPSPDWVELTWMVVSLLATGRWGPSGSLLRWKKNFMALVRIRPHGRYRGCATPISNREPSAAHATCMLNAAARVCAPVRHLHMPIGRATCRLRRRRMR